MGELSEHVDELTRFCSRPLPFGFLEPITIELAPAPAGQTDVGHIRSPSALHAKSANVAPTTQYAAPGSTASICSIAFGLAPTTVSGHHVLEKLSHAASHLVAEIFLFTPPGDASQSPSPIMLAAIFSPQVEDVTVGVSVNLNVPSGTPLWSVVHVGRVIVTDYWADS
jgi:hypothetical protein